MWILDHQITRGSLGAQLSVMRTGSHTSVSLFSPISGALVTPWSASRNRNPLSGVSSFIHNPEKCRQGQIKVVYSIFTMICHDLPWFTMIYPYIPWICSLKVAVLGILASRSFRYLAPQRPRRGNPHNWANRRSSRPPGSVPWCSVPLPWTTGQRWGLPSGYVKIAIENGYL